MSSPISKKTTIKEVQYTLSSYTSSPGLTGLDRKILIICQGNLALFREALLEINPLNLTVVVCKEEQELSDHHGFSMIHYVKEYFSSGELEKVCYNLMSKTQFNLIVAPSETDILRAARLRELFHLEGQSYKSALVFRDKIYMKTLLQENQIEVPAFVRATSALDVLEFVAKYDYPFIVKPSRGYGSIQTRVLRNSQDVSRLLEEALFDEFHQADFDLEQFINGEMYHVDGIVREGEVVVVWPSKCINTCLEMKAGKPTGGYLLSVENEIVPLLNRYAIKVLGLLPMPQDGGFHLELFYDGKKIVFCEIASRIGGPWINDLWVYGMNIDLKKEFIKAQALASSDLVGKAHTPGQIIGGIIFPPRKGKVVSVADRCELKGVIQYTPLVEPGTSLEQPSSMLGHIASFTVSASSEGHMVEIIKQVERWFQDYIKIDEMA